MARGRARAAGRGRRLLVVAVVVSALAGCTETDTGSTSGRTQPATGAETVVRVDQNGYEPDVPAPLAVMADHDLAGTPYRVRGADDTTVSDGTVGASAGAWNDAWPFVHVVEVADLGPGTYRLEVDGTTSAPFRVAPAADLFDPVLALTVRFFQAQRDGADVLPDVMDRKPSHLLDEAADVYAVPTYADDAQVGVLEPIGGPVDVSGGWFDAGDFLKITGTTAYATIALLVAERHRPDTPGLAAEVDHGLAWLDRMWDADRGVLHTQVGIGIGNATNRSDHDAWRLPEDDDAADVAPGDPDFTISHRPVFAANAPGEPVSPNLAGRVAAAFALASTRSSAAGDDAAARRWLDRAVALYEAADTDPEGPLTSAVPNAFYPEESWADDLELAAATLAVAGEAVGDDRAAGWADEGDAWAARYLETAEDAGGTLGVADVSALAHAELVAAGTDDPDPLTDDLHRQLDLAADRAAADPFGAGVDLTEYDSAPNALAVVATAALLAEAAPGAGPGPALDALARRQRSWVLGANPWGSSFLIGVGDTSPTCPEHQVANLTGLELTGALVNGPNSSAVLAEPNTLPGMVPCEGPDLSDFDGHGAAYLDAVGSWQTVEPAVDFTGTAALAFALAARP